MIKQLLNIGVSNTNDDNLNRKIRISNLISITTIVTMFGYIPVAIYFNVLGIIILNTLFLLSSLISFCLHFKRHHNTAFYSASSYGLIYFTISSVFYGLPSNLHFFILVMCLIAIALFESNLLLNIYVSIAVISFFSLIIHFKNKAGIIDFAEEMKKIQSIVSVLNLLFLFLITILFFVFFRRDNLVFQKEILNQKKLLKKNKKKFSIQFITLSEFKMLC